VVARATASVPRRALVYAAYFAVIAAMIYFGKHTWDGTFYAFAILYFGGLHILYDGFVWKLRKPATAASLGITPSTAGPRPSSHDGSSAAVASISAESRSWTRTPASTRAMPPS